MDPGKWLDRREAILSPITHWVGSARFAAALARSAWSLQGIANVKKQHDLDAPGERSGVSIKCSLLAAGFAALVSASAWATPDPDAVARANWSTYMARFPSPDEGCFHAAYPSIVWERVPCKTGHPRVHPTPVHRGASG